MTQHIDITRVTENQLAATHKVVDLTNKKVFYLVENSRGLTNEAGEIVEYKVAWDPRFNLIRCQPFNGPACPASEQGLTCWHLRSACKAAADFKARIAEQEAILREIEQDDCELALEAMYTVEVDPTSSSLDGQKWEVCPASGNRVPMR